jgi:uncharacterized RDD family membrane protein YckC
VNTSPRPGSGRPSGVPYPPSTPFRRDELPDRGQPGAPGAWGLRATARIIDLVIVLMPATLLAGALGVERNADGELIGPSWPRLIFPISFLVYETVLISGFGQTIGKYLCRVKAVEWSTGELPTPREAAIRALVPGIWFLLSLIDGAMSLLIFVPVIVYLTSVADTLYRGVHDKAANTIVLADPRGRRTTI